MKMNKRRASLAAVAAVIAAALLFSMFPSGPAKAIDAGDVMDKMESRERTGFVGGAVDMAAHLYAVSGNRQKADCAVNWLFGDPENAWREIFDFFDAHKDKDAVGLLSILIDRHCGK